MDGTPGKHLLRKAPSGLGILLAIGPSLVWCSEYIGSGEVILATRTGAILGSGILWAIVAGIVLKFWIGMSGARYTVATGEGMIDMVSRVPGPKNWGVWVILVAQFLTAALAIGSIASAAGIFVANIFGISRQAGGWIITILAFVIAWKGEFRILKIIMSILVFVVIAGVLNVALRVMPSFAQLVEGFLMKVPEVPAWAVSQGVNENAWSEILPLIGWGAGGFASQVWYTYWVIGAGYGNARKDVYGIPADTRYLKNTGTEDAHRLKSWFRVVYSDATLAMIIGVVVTAGFLFAGAGILRPLELAPGSERLAAELSGIFATRWGKAGGLLFMIGGLSALFATQIGQLAGWPRLLADSFRICIPGFTQIKWKTQF
ncbi:MAG TPA: Nramp family divalent metal transporter, partial [Bacteroidales bacterium]|nr:Nramp family divalent metal transporter [Bacteroidales bacterium]